MTRFLLATAIAFSLAGAAGAATYEIDANHTQVWFTYSHFGYSNLSGRLNQVSGKLEFNPAKPAAASIEVELPMSSLSTGVPKLDAHLSSADFFEVEKYPTASFKSTGVAVLDDKHLRVAGDLSIHGVTRAVTLAVTINSLAAHRSRKTPMAGFDATTTIKRSEFGVDRMAPGVADEIQLRISMEAAVPKTEAASASAGKG